MILMSYSEVFVMVLIQYAALMSMILRWRMYSLRIMVTQWLLLDKFLYV